MPLCGVPDVTAAYRAVNPGDTQNKHDLGGGR
jgi:hypothetical protein